jgi:O-antigen ligase
LGLNANGMEPFDRRSGREGPILRGGEATLRPKPERTSSRVRTPKPYRICDALTAALIFFMVVFAPWAFGTTQDWAISTMNITGYALGALLLAKWLIAQQSGYRPSRWGSQAESEEIAPIQLGPTRRDPLTLALVVLTLVILAYTFVSALNARATYVWWERRFIYRDSCIQWLPHSYDRWSTWRALWMYIGLACFFWAVWDWLLGKSGRDRRRNRRSQRDVIQPALGRTGAREPRGDGSDLASDESASGDSQGLQLPRRLRILLWVLCINGAILALESILQRLSGTNKLLWLVESRFTDGPAQFGPYAYRANAASYFNLLWPVCFGFWFILRRSAKPSLRVGHRLGSGSHLVLLPGAVLMAACPIISTTRGGALVAVALILLTMTLLLWVTRKESLWFRLGICSLFAVILGFSAFLGYKQLAVRFQTIFTDQMSRRTEIYQNALPIARDFPILGTGPGTFGSLYQLYRSDVSQVWAAYVHDDWLETRITFGWVGFSFILLGLAVVLARWFRGGGILVAWEFTVMIWLAMAGCLLHAKFDFPFQIYSIVLLFLLLSAILFCIARPGKTA